MASQFISVPLKDLGAGIDQLSAETALAEGYSESLLNFDPTAEGYLRKRPGYEQVGGRLPVRVASASQSGGTLYLTLDGSTDLSAIRSTPLVVYGRTSAATSGDFTTTDGARYYSGFTPQIRKSLAAATSGTLSVPASESGMTATPFLVGLAQASDLVSPSNSVLVPDGVTLDTSAYGLTVAYNNTSASAVDAFVYYLSRPSLAETTYVTTGHAPGTSISISQATHGLSSLNILPFVWEESGTDLLLRTPDQITVATTGDVTLTFSAAPAGNLTILLTVPADSAVATGTAPAGTTTTVLLTDLGSPYLFPVCYLEQTLGGTRELVLPDSVVVDWSAQTATVTFDNEGATDATFFVTWLEGETRSNRLAVTAATSDTWSDSSPQLTVWGLDHATLYGDSPTGTAPGWTTHIDTYRSAGEQRLVAGLGGVLHSLQTRSEAGTSYLLPLLYPNLRARVSAAVTVGPAFEAASAPSGRTRGTLQFDGGDEGWGSGTAFAYDASNGWVKVTLSLPSLTVNGALSTVIEADADYLTVADAPLAVHAGTWLIRQVQQSGDGQGLYVWVENSAVTNTDADDTGCAARCGVFSDRLTTSTDSPFIPGDTLGSTLWTDTTAPEVLSASGTTTVIGGVTEASDVPAGLQLVGTRTGRVMPLRTLSGTSSVTNLVAGDSVSYSPLERSPVVVGVVPLADRAVTITSDGETATATLGSGTTADLSVGQRVLLVRCGAYSGEQVVTDIPTTTTFEFASTETEADSGTLLGYTAELDESFQWSDSIGSTNSLSVPERWIPVEAPDDSFARTPATRFSYLPSADYDSQPTVRSVGAADSLYLTNGADPVLKFDGTSLYRAGLFRWQAEQFVGVDTSASAKIDLTGITKAVTVASAPSAGDLQFKVALGQEANFLVGNVIIHSGDGARYTVTALTDDGTNGLVTVDRGITSTTAGTITRVAIRRYYARLNAIDANQNLVASAVTGSEDWRVELSASAAVSLRLVGLPAWGALDYDRLEVQLYGTKLASGVAPFYRLTALPMQWDASEGYLDFVDTVTDDLLFDTSLDPVNSALVGAELGTQWSQPLRAGCVSSADGSLLLANVTSDPTLDIRMIYTGTVIDTTALSGLKFTFRKDNTDTGTTTDGVNRMVYEFKTSTSGTVSGITSTSTYFEVTTSAGHGLSDGDWVYLSKNSLTADNSVRYAGWFQVYNASGSTFRVRSTKNYGASAGADVDRWTKATASANVPVLLGNDGNHRERNGSPGTSTAWEFQAMRRLASAINASMRNMDVSQASFASFVPWMTAGAGGSYAAGQMVVTQPGGAPTVGKTLEVKLPAFGTAFAMSVGGVLRTSASEASAVEYAYPSRLLASLTNYPEIFDNPTAALDTQSRSVLDVNPADGEAIQAILPFFGDSAFGASQKSGIVVVWKQTRIYVVDLSAKARGLPYLQEVNTGGVGLSAPASVARTDRGPVWAHTTGIFRLTQALQVEPIGRKLWRYWRQTVTGASLDAAAGTFYAGGSQYRLSVPVDAATTPSELVVYDVTREVSPDGYRYGSWTRYDAHPAIGACNLGDEGYWASTSGRVYRIRKLTDERPFRDGNVVISASADLRILDFGDANLRKLVGGITVGYRGVGDSASTVVSVAGDCSDDFQEADAVTVTADPASAPDGLGDAAGAKVQSVLYSSPVRRANHLQVRVSNAGADEACEVAGVAFRVAGLSTQGTKQAAETR